MPSQPKIHLNVEDHLDDRITADLPQKA